MADQQPVPVSQMPSYAPDFAHELVWQQVRRLFAEELERAGARMATVAETATGSGVIVLFDGKGAQTGLPDKRTVGRIAGQRYTVGQRVAVAKIQGKYIALGTIVGQVAGDEAVVGTADLKPGAVKGALDRDNVSLIPPDRSITYMKIGVNQVFGVMNPFGGASASSIAPLSIGAGDIGDAQVTNAKIASVNASKVNGLTFSTISGRITSDQIGAQGFPGGPAVLGGNIGNDAVGNRNLQEDSVDQRVLANNSVGYQNCTAELQSMIKKAGKGKKKTKSYAQQWDSFQPEDFPPEDGSE